MVEVAERRICREVDVEISCIVTRVLYIFDNSVLLREPA